MIFEYAIIAEMSFLLRIAGFIPPNPLTGLFSVTSAASLMAEKKQKNISVLR